MTTKTSEEFHTFDKAMDKILSVKPEELKKRLATAKQAKTGKRYPKEGMDKKVPPKAVNR
jgi:hypothetical protein